jgi:hypothetical protein
LLRPEDKTVQREHHYKHSEPASNIEIQQRPINRLDCELLVRLSAVTKFPANLQIEIEQLHGSGFETHLIEDAGHRAALIIQRDKFGGIAGGYLVSARLLRQ